MKSNKKSTPLPKTGSQKVGSYAAFDLDGTLIRKNSSFAFCSYLASHGFFSRRDLLFCTRCYLEHRLFDLSLFRLHEKVFRRLFIGKKISDFEPLVAPFLKQKVQKMLYQPAIERMCELRSQGVEIAILSNSPSFIVEPIAEYLGVESTYATEYRLDEEGSLLEIKSLVDGEKKAEYMERQQARETYAFSDSMLDLPLLKSASVAVAVNPRIGLKRFASKQKWEIL